MKGELAALTSLLRTFKRKLERGESWPPSAPIPEPVGYEVTFEIGDEAAKQFGWQTAIDTVAASTDERRARIVGLQEYIATCTKKLNSGEPWPESVPIPRKPGYVTLEMMGQTVTIKLPTRHR